jgi:rod shape-determining protein MreD
MYWTIWGGIALLFLVFQTVFGNLLSIGKVKPDLILIVIIFFSFKKNQVESSILSFACGIAQDSLSGGMLGINAFIKTVIGLITSIIKKTYTENPVSIMVSLFLFTILQNFLIFLLKSIFEATSPSFFIMTRIAPFEAIYNMILGVLLFPLFKRIKV